MPTLVGDGDLWITRVSPTRHEHVKGRGCTIFGWTARRSRRGPDHLTVTGTGVVNCPAGALTTARSSLDVALPPDATRPAVVVYMASSRTPPLGALAQRKDRVRGAAREGRGDVVTDHGA